MRATVAALLASRTILVAPPPAAGAPGYDVTLRDGVPQGDALVDAAGGPVLRVSTGSSHVIHLHG